MKHRVFVKKEDGELERLAYTKYNRLWDLDPNTTILEFADKELPTLLIVANDERIIYIESTLMKINKTGHVSEEWRKQLFRDSAEMLGNDDTEIKAAYHEKYKWEPTREELQTAVRLCNF